MNADLSSLRQDIDEQLDRMLAVWAQSHELTPARTEAVRRKVLTRARHPGLDWDEQWTKLVSPPAFGATALAPGLLAMYQTLADVVPGWPMPKVKYQSGYRPYLRVA